MRVIFGERERERAIKNVENVKTESKSWDLIKTISVKKIVKMGTIIIF